jgi:phosphatidyl-myo-inositol dimannoside synthase
MKILYLATDAFGGHGGIAQYNRDMIEAMCRDSGVRRVVAVARTAQYPVGELPAKLDYRTGNQFRRLRFVADAFRTAFTHSDTTLLYCAHLNLAPLVWLLAKLLGRPWVLAIYGIDAWEGRESRRRRFFALRADLVLSISQITLDRFRSWCPVPEARTIVVPNAVHLEKFGTGPKNKILIERYGLIGRRIIMSLGRLESYERFKGFDAMMEALPLLIRDMPDLRYLIAGSGADLERLKTKAATLGLAQHVVFTGAVDESEKADHYRLADAFVLASKGEGFGFVLLEAMACGIPVIASSKDGGREAVRAGMLGRLVDPDNPQALSAAVRTALVQPKIVPSGLQHFAFSNFAHRVSFTLAQVVPQWHPYAARGKAAAKVLLGASSFIL